MADIFFGDTGPIRFTPPVADAVRERAAQHLELEPITQSEWRVRDARLGEDDPRKLVGFIEQNAAGFGAMLLDDGHPSSWVSYDSMDDALRHFETAPSPAGSQAATESPATGVVEPSPELASVGATALAGVGTVTEADAPAPSRGRHHPRHSAKK